MRVKKSISILMILSASMLPTSLFAHCEIPCGIFGDKMRFDMWLEQITTVEKSMTRIVELSQAGDKNYNQIVRWVTNKDEHADDIRDIAVDYFLAQRIKPVADLNDKAAVEKYQKSLQALHHIIVHSMNAKQTTDLQHIERLRALVAEFYELYFDEKMKAHLEEHKH